MLAERDVAKCRHVRDEAINPGANVYVTNGLAGEHTPCDEQILVEVVPPRNPARIRKIVEARIQPSHREVRRRADMPPKIEEEVSLVAW